MEEIALLGHNYSTQNSAKKIYVHEMDMHEYEEGRGGPHQVLILNEDDLMTGKKCSTFGTFKSLKEDVSLPLTTTLVSPKFNSGKQSEVSVRQVIGEAPKA